MRLKMSVYVWRQARCQNRKKIFDRVCVCEREREAWTPSTVSLSLTIPSIEKSQKLVHCVFIVFFLNSDNKRTLSCFFRSSDCKVCHAGQDYTLQVGVWLATNQKQTSRWTDCNSSVSPASQASKTKQYCALLF